MRLAIVTNVLTPYRLPLFEAMARRVDDLALFVMADTEENRQWNLESTRLAVHVLKGLHLRPNGAEVSLHWNYGVGASLRRYAPDVVMSGGFAPANLAAFLFCQRAGVAYVSWGEFTLRDNARSSLWRRGLRRWLIGGSQGCIASSREARDAFVHYGAKDESILTASMPIDVARIHRVAQAFRGSPQWEERRRAYSTPIVLSVGRLTDQKGYPELLALYERVITRCPSVTLLLVGDGPARPAYEAHVQRKGWSQVRFAGFADQDKVAEYLALGDVFVFPTRSDTYGAVLAEAMAAELPVVSSIHAAATDDLVINGVNGYAVDPSATESTADRLVELLTTSNARRRQMGHAAYQAVEGTAIEPSADRMVEFLERGCRPIEKEAAEPLAAGLSES